MSARITLGRIEITLVSVSTLRINGGDMFGVIPGVLWGREIASIFRRGRLNIAPHGSTII
jgi:hypothetical protein